MNIHNLAQGSPEWLAHRRSHFNASDAPAMMGCSPYKTRAQLLHELHTGIAPEADAGQQKRFDQGHRAEALARPLAEEIIGAVLYPVTGSVGRLSASFDGLVLDESEAFEHKALNAAILDAFRAMDAMGPHDDEAACRLLPIYHRVQMEHQLHVSGAGRTLFMASEWGADDELVQQRHCWYYPDAELRAAILSGWDQFAADLAAYVPPGPAAEPARAEPMESLPAVSVRMDGALSVAGNLPTFAAALRAFIDRMPAKPATDTEFATTEAACKALKRAEEALDAAEAGALASITDVEAMRRAVADCRKLARDTRLAAEKMVDRRKVEIKEQAVMAARRALADHVGALNAELAPVRLQQADADFAGAIKGLRSISSMQDALDTTLAQAKIAADAQARGVRANLAAYREQAAGIEFLFADLPSIAHKATDDFAALLHARIATHRAAEAERERKRKVDEDARIQAEAQRLAAKQAEDARVAALAEQRRQDAAAESARVAQQQAQAAQQVAAQPVAAPTPAPAAPEPVARPAAPAPAPRVDEPATLKLGDINARLHPLRIDGAGMSELGIGPARIDGAAKLYRESDFRRLLASLSNHLDRVAAGQAAAA